MNTTNEIPTTVKLARTCDGKEQYAFEEWARTQQFDMHEHPLHYLFLDNRTDAARNGWKAGLVYASWVAQAALTAAGVNGWQPIEQFAGSGPSDSVIVAVICDGREPVVGEAYFDPEAYEGTWWWAGTSRGEYHDSPIEECNFGRVAFFQPMPVFDPAQCASK